MPSDESTSPGPTSRIARLSDADAEAVDGLFEHGLDESQDPDDDRANAVRELLSILEDYPVEPASEELVDATLARVARDESERRERFSIDAGRGTPGRGIRLPDFFAVAASMLLAVGIGWPLYQTIDDQNDISRSKQRLQAYGAGIVDFGNTTGTDMLPIDEGLIHELDYSPSKLPCAVKGRWGRHLLDLPGVSDPWQSSLGPVSYRVPVSIRTFRLSSYGPGEPLLATTNPVVAFARGETDEGDHLDGSPSHHLDRVVILRFDLSDLRVAVSEHGDVDGDGDSIWVHDGYTGDVDDVIQPSSLQDAVLAH